MSDPLCMALKKMVIRDCNVAGVTFDQVTDEDPVIGGTLPLDSLDAVEIVSALERNFGIRLESPGAARHVFKSFKVMADYIRANSSPDRIESFLS